MEGVVQIHFIFFFLTLSTNETRNRRRYKLFLGTPKLLKLSNIKKSTKSFRLKIWKKRRARGTSGKIF